MDNSFINGYTDARRSRPAQPDLPEGAPLKISKNCLSTLANIVKRLEKHQKVIPHNYPQIAILGMNNDGVAVGIHFLKYGSCGCSYMPNIESEDFSKGVFKLVKRGLHPCGLIRIMAHPPSITIDSIDSRTGRMTFKPRDINFDLATLRWNGCRDKKDRFNLGTLFTQNPDFRSITLYGRDTCEMIIESIKGGKFQFHQWMVT